MMMKDGVSIGEVTLDSPDVSHILNPTKVSFLWTDTVVDSHGLVLREGTNPDDEYTRVGVGMIYKRFTDILSDSKPRTIKLI